MSSPAAHPKAEIHGAKRFLTARDLVLLCGAVTLCLVAWELPIPKDAAVAGRLSYAEFLLALLASGLLLGIVVVLLPPPEGRRLMLFRVLAIALGGGGALLGWELIFWLLPAGRLTENPFFMNFKGGVEASDDLPFVRPPHLHWEGWSRGDLNHSRLDWDPYATRITFVTDHEGFRNHRDLTQADLIFVGDSFTEAGNMAEEQTYVRRTEVALGRVARNLGRAGYAPPTELIVLKKYGLKCRPRAVVWQVAESNDLTESAMYQDWVAGGRQSYLAQGIAGKGQISQWERFSLTWRLFCLLRTHRPWPLRGSFQDRAGQFHEVRFYDFPNPAVHSPVGHPGWPILAQALQEGAQLLRQEKIPLILLLIPTKFRGLGSAIEHPEAPVALPDADSWEIPESQTLACHLKQLGDKLEVPFVDMTPAFRKSAAAGDLPYLPRDTHLSSLGHQIVSDALVEPLRSALK